MSGEEVTVSGLRAYRDELIEKGNFPAAETVQQRLDDETGVVGETAALESGRDERIHEPIDDLDELRQRKEEAAYYGFPKLAEDYDKRIEKLTPDEDEEPSAAALEQQKRAALAEPDDDLDERTRAALTARDAVNVTERGQPAPQYVFDHYDVDPREYDDEYALRSKLASIDPKRPEPEEETVSDAEAALSIGDRGRLAHSDKSRRQFIREQYGVEPDDYDDVEDLREAIREAGGYEDDNPDAPSRSSAWSDPNERL